MERVISRHRQNAYCKINEELVTMYLEIGEYLSDKVASKKPGYKVIETIVEKIKKRIRYLRASKKLAFLG